GDGGHRHPHVSPTRRSSDLSRPLKSKVWSWLKERPWWSTVPADAMAAPCCHQLQKSQLSAGFFMNQLKKDFRAVPGSFSRIKASPIRKAFTFRSRITLTSSGERIPLSVTTILSGPI